MPQMAPMWWTLLMLLFIIMMMIMMSLIYFNYTNKSKFNLKKNMNNMNWKW
uniref:ATP synthase complex subunit 8 n=1 Tax=Anagonalia melichari TaxID=700735 RepID=A0A8K1HVL1_9HEMI|nr:ATP synthase F0 subunit 8 [Anagonalia melichari]